MYKYLKSFIFTIIIFSLLSFTVTFAKAQTYYSFDDIKEYKWAIKAVEKMHAKGIIKGVGDKKFAPSKPVTHLEALALILRTLGYEETSELPKEYRGEVPAWGKEFIGLAYEKGLVTSEELKTFNPNKDAKRYEIAKYLVRALGLEKEAKLNMNQELSYKDWKAVPKDSKGYMYVAVKEGLIVGDGKNLKPNEPVKRIEMAVILERLDEKIGNTISSGKEVIGTVYQADESSITVKVGNLLKTFPVIKNVPVFDGNDYLKIDSLKKGYTVRLILDGKNNIIFVEVLNKNSEEVIPIQLEKAISLPQNVLNLVESLKETQNVKLVEENGTYYIIATRGMMRTGGYSVSIEKAQIIKSANKTTLEVEIKYQNPSENAIVTQAITYPYDVKMFKYDGKIDDIKILYKYNVAP
ncbi:MAG: S-layer-like proteiny domain protein [Caldanaerobacter subterraneus]|jgi:hypothetical protein|uniref:S-layer protein n=1 Tax=Caldanaerobacter subterraneus TaxID=911092 RepID=A0A124FCL3_9THEO|nr:S-layer homology domain-containing protein [Caldanaerobacter subterraneus]KUK09024.1 MAG: S-layer-like proteiny domain protein [Caldanaerobacter subterraneus]HBT49248.1 S-layer protein [Caldanaerobacter subterraneus]